MNAYDLMRQSLAEAQQRMNAAAREGVRMSETPKQRFERLRPLTPAFIADGTLRKRISNKLTDEECIGAGRSQIEIARAGGRSRARQMRAAGQEIPIYRRKQS